MRPNNIEDIYPLSPLQQGILFHTLYAAEPGSYVIQVAWTLRGHLDVAAFHQAFADLVERHAALRTAFAWEKLDAPVQIVWRRLKVAFDEQDLRALPAAEQDARVRRFEQEDRDRGFDPTRAPLLRVALLRLADDAHRLVWSMHHLLLDGWSMQIVVKELFALHEARAAGREIRLDRPRAYGELIKWLGKQDRERDEAFWRRQLEGFAAPTPLGVDHPPDGGPARFGEQHLALPEAVGAALSSFAKERRLTLSTLVQGAWAILLSRLSGEEDVLFGTTVSGRSAPLPGIEGMVGLFINTLPVRVRARPEAPALAWLEDLQQYQAELRDHEHSPLVEVQALSAVPRGTALFESLVVFENFPITGSAGPRGARAALALTEAQGKELPPYPLTLTGLFQRTLELRIGYDARRFDDASVARLLGHLATLLQGILAAPEAPLGRLPLLTAAELRDLDAWNETAAARDRDLLLHELCEAQATRTPDAVAVVMGERSLTYRALHERASRLADHLVGLGVGPDVRVGVFMERSLDLPVALLGVLQAGGAYVPIDPSYPRERTAFMLADAGAPVLLTQEHLLGDLPRGAARVVVVDAEPAPRTANAARPVRTVRPENLAYVIYTSGSTGQPKGVMVPHRAIVNHAAWMRALWPVGTDDAMLQRTASSFDASLTEIFLPLTTGARLVLARPGGQRDLDYVAELMAEERVTLAVLVPSLLRALVDEPALSECTALRRVLSGGEALPAALASRFREKSPADLYNFYGPTEAAVDVSWFDCASPSATTVVPIGRPVADTQLHVLDRRLDRVPVGVPGELHVGGRSLAHGYWSRPELTAERFVPDPFGAAPGARLYRTGDLCRRRGDGVLEVLGRVDFQVKLRGFRIELAEIEAALAALPEVREAAVVVREDTPGDQRLVAYVVAAEGDAPAAGDLRAALAARLPEPMIPAAYVVLSALPLSPNGKVDRRALPVPGAGALVTHADVAPRTPIEQAVAAIFAEVLKLPAPQVGAHDGFFDLGGHSLLATQAVSRIRAALGVDLPLRALFEAPSVADLAARIEAFTMGAPPPNPRLEASRGAAAPVAAIPRDRDLPLSFGQERLWFLAQLDPASPAYVISFALRIRGDLDVAALERTLAEVVRRHEVLRTTFHAERGKPVPVIHAPGPFPLARASLTALPAEAREQAVRAEAEAEARRPFDLAAGPVIRARLLEVAVADHVLLVALHHIVSDAWTGALLDREITALYTAFSKGEPSPLPDLALQYVDYAAWQRARLSGDTLQTQLDYWKAQLAGAPPALDLPTDRPRPRVPSSRGGQRAFALSPQLSAGVRELARREGATLYMTLLAAFDVLLHRHSGQDDIVVGTPIAGRTRAETEGMIGFFLNSLVMRARVSPEETFKELLARVKETALGAYAHQDMPFERLVQELQPEPDPSRSPLFQVIFNLQNAPRESLRLPGLKLARFAPYGATVKVDLTLIMADDVGGIVGRFEYATDLFDAATIDRLVRQLETLLGAVVKDPQRRLRELPVLPDDERRLLLSGWNDTEASFSTRECVHELFEAQVDEGPDDPALVAGAARLSYRELDQRGNQLAHHLRRLGVGPDAVVGLCCERGADLVVALLGILKAGGAYLPLDPAYPPQRLARIVGEARAAVVVTHAALADRLPAVTLVRLDADAAAIAAESDARPGLEATSANLAYVLFTSGSTGVPKGVAVEHRQLVNYVRGVAPRLDLPRGATYAHVSTFSADLGNTVLFPALTGGGCLHVLAAEVTTDADAFAAYFQREGIDCLKIVPSHLAALLSAASADQVIPRRLLVLGGEACSYDLVDRIERLAPDCRILNHYGPTETTVGVLTHAVEKGRRPPDLATVPLGRPLPNTRVYVLDAQMTPTPTGVPGEVYLGGAGVTRGYLGRPQLTAERFVKDPFSTAPGARLYRTGDRARYRPDGALLFLGRVDFQVKIRGFRVELGEVEAALGACPGVREAAVLVEEEAPGTSRLVAYVVPQTPALDLAALRAFVAERLPEPMIPATFVVLDAMPLTPNGKVDRRALAAVERVRDAPVLATPRTPVEEVLAAIWADVFGREGVGIHERFGDLGGHSLLAIQIIARAREALEVQVPLRAIFEAPTVAALAAHIEALSADGERAVAPPVEPVRRDVPLPLSFAQERLWLLDQIEPNRGQYNVSSAARLQGALDAGALERALRAVVQRHEALRTTFAFEDGQAVQKVHADAELALAVEDLGELPAGAREVMAQTRAAEEAAAPFDLARGPLLRARLLRLGPEAHVLLLTVHHIVSDATTQRILDREVATLYDAFRSGEPSPLPALPLQYADYAVWQRRWLSGEVLDRQLGYWKTQLAGASFALDLPSDRPRPPVMSYRGGRRPFALPASLRAPLAELSRRRGVTLFMTLLAAFDVLLRRWSGQRDLVVGTPMTNRTRAETEGIVGFFLNTLVLRAQLDDAMPFEALLQQVREVCLGAYAHQDLPFERLVHELSPQRDLSRTPLFQVMFTLQTAAAEASPLAGLRRRALPGAGGTAKVDLSLFVIESPQGLSGVFEYAADLFDAATLDRMAAQLPVLLAGIVAAPDAPLGALPLLPEVEVRRLLVEWNATAVATPRPATVVDLFAAQVERAPDAPALASGDVELSYRELDARARRLAVALRARGVGPDVRVGVCLERSPALVVALLAVLQAGGAYVPLDPAYPRERLAFMAADADLQLLLTETSLSAVVPAPRGGMIHLDAESDVEDAAGEAPRHQSPQPESLAYVLYTSGSTGRPKGVAVPHRALTNFLLSMAQRPGLDAGDRLLAVTSLSFDIAGLELWLPLTVGARVEIAAREVVADGAALAERLYDGKITVLQATPATFRLLLDTGWEGSARLTALVGGEAVPAGLAYDLTGRVRALWNMYGPTETTIWSCVHPLHENEPVLVGRPIANTRAYVLDERGEPVPIGAVGELYLGGDGLARGYLGRPDLTAARFVPDALGGAAGARLYRTGDRSRYRADGALEILGRTDFQIKIRGHRVELGEIEAVLGTHPSVRDAVVVARDRGPEDPHSQLVAYLVTRGDDPPSALNLRAFLVERLPEYMVPAAFVALPALPKTPAGKVDRRALPEPSADSVPSQPRSVTPRDEVEIRLAAIWRDILDLRAVGVTDSFFDLGGHSLLAVRMMAEVERAFGVKVPLVVLFESQSIEALARILRSGVKPGAWPAIVPVRAHGSLRPLFLVARPNVNALGYIAVVRGLDPDQPVYGLQMQYPEEAALGRPYTLAERAGWARHYLELMRAVQPEGPYLLAGMCEGGLIAFEMARLLEAAGDRVAVLGVLDTWPEENTSDPFLHALYIYDRKTRDVLRAPLPDQLAFVKQRSAKALRDLTRRLRAPRGNGAPRPSPWDGRLFPGPSFVAPRVRCRIDVFRTRSQPYWRIADRELGWGARTAGGVDVHYIDGDHETFMRAQHVGPLAQKLRERLRVAAEEIQLLAVEAQARGAE